MNNEAYAKVKAEYDSKRDKKISAAKYKKDSVFNKDPKLQELQESINQLGLEVTRTILTTHDELKKQIEQENLQIKIKSLEEKIEKELKKLGYIPEDFVPDFDCKLCNDTGFVLDDKKNTKYCSCFLQQVINESFNEANMLSLKDENFETFDIGFYSKNPDKKKYGIDKSPLENIEAIRKLSLKFCDNIDLKEQKNLLFTGNTGLGKTFLANCIAGKLIKNNKSVVYQTAPILMDKIIEYKFSNKKDNKEASEYKKIFDSDLLIIDDLGTESMNNMKFTELFNIINTRILNNKKILISTNLTLNDLYKEYDERVMSRLIGNFVICKFVGEDIRLKKKKIN